MKYSEFKIRAQDSKTDKMTSDKLYGAERNFATFVAFGIHTFLPFVSANAVSFSSIMILGAVFFTSVSYDNYSFMDRTWLFILQMIFLYSLTIIDKIDGSLARVKDKVTQFGQYLDMAVHFFYPLVFYFTVGHLFYSFGYGVEIFYVTLFLGAITQKQIFFLETKLAIKDKILSGKLKPKDLRPIATKDESRPNIIFRMIDYLTFMIYAWTLFYYLGVAVVLMYNPDLAFWLYIAHIALSLLIVSYKVFYSYPKKKLFSEKIRQ